jgi:tripartite-type tricarboxylate transporter receptor subunit TctC
VKVAAWFGLAAPAGTPKEIVDKLNAEFVKVSKDPEFIKRLADNGTPIITTTPERMGELMAKEWEETGDLVRAIGMKQQN